MSTIDHFPFRGPFRVFLGAAFTGPAKLPAPRRIEITWQAAILLFPEKARRCILLFKISSGFR
jgi:hypothetical protein